MNVNLGLLAQFKCQDGDRGRSSAGHSIIEVLVAFSFLIVGAFGFLKVMVSTSSASDVNYEVALAKEAARTQIEFLMSLDYQEAFARHNGSTADDPVGVTSPGSDFAVDGLNAAAGDADGMAGEIVFPSPAATPTQVREDTIDQGLGCPRDLNGDLLIDATDHSADCLIIPVIVRITWQGQNGPCISQFKTVLGAIH